MRRVVVSGIGIVSSIGADAAAVSLALREARSGVVAAPEYTQLGFRCQVHAPPTVAWETLVDRRAARFLAPGTGYGHIALKVEDLDATLQDLAKLGIDPEKAPYQVRPGGTRLCFVRDPDSYRVELIDS